MYHRWGSLLVLTIGVTLTQLSSSSDNEKTSTTLGFLAVLVAAVLSGFAGVYFERILKNSKSTVWMRNIQMAFSSIGLALGGVYFSVGRLSIVTDHSPIRTLPRCLSMDFSMDIIGSLSQLFFFRLVVALRFVNLLGCRRSCRRCGCEIC